MFYVSSVIDKDKKIGITDTKDGVEEFYTDAQIAKLINENKIDIYGTSYYNYKANCTALEINKKLSESQLKLLISEWGRLHNQWTGHVVEDYLASAKIGTKIFVDYVITAEESRRKISATAVLERLNYDEWYYQDEANTFSGSKGSSRFAAGTLESCCLYSKPKSITIMSR